MAEISFNTPHAPFGAFSSFTCGYAASWDTTPAANSGGFSPSSRHPAAQSMFIGWRRGEGSWNLFPFLKERADRSNDFTSVDLHRGKNPAPHPFRVLEEQEISRSLGLASDRWQAGPLDITIYSPFERIPEWETLDEVRQRLLCAPVSTLLCKVDNRSGIEDLEFIFGFADTERGLRFFADTEDTLTGFASGVSYGFAARPQPGLRARSGMDLFSTWKEDSRGLHLLGSEAALILRVTAGEIQNLPLALGFFQGGQITTGLKASFYYTRFFSELEQVLEFGLANFTQYQAIAEARDAEMAATGLSKDRTWLLAHSVHSYLASTELLQRDGKALWAVNEGEYRMLNTFDLTVDHLFFELAWWPWAIRDTLDLFADRYSYVDSIHSPDGRHAAGGVTFTHDMGVDNQFTRAGWSSYELPNLNGCFSHMSAEQLVNWICCAVAYAEKTEDYAWLAQRLPLLRNCAESLRRRDDPDPARRNGIIKWDSDRCGPTGSEITTYDSLDVSLGQARNNLYLAVKTMAAWILLSRAFTKLGQPDESRQSTESTILTATTIMTFRESGTGLFPAVFEGDNRSRIIPAIEGLAFPLYLAMDAEIEQLDKATGVVTALGQHLAQVLQRGICLDQKSGGWKLSSTSENTWLSKIFLSQYVCAKLFPELLTGDAGAPADEAHRKWLLSPASRHLAFCDQMRSTDGFPFGSKYYPRGVSAWLWVL